MKFKKGIISRENGFLVQTLFVIFYIFERMSLFYWVRIIGSYIHQKRNGSGRPFVKSYIFPEIWTVGNIAFAIFADWAVGFLGHQWMRWLLLIYAIERIFEMFVYQVNVMFFHRLNRVFLDYGVEINVTQNETGENIVVKEKKEEIQRYAIKSSTRTVIMLILNILEYILQFNLVFAIVNILYPNSVMSVGIVGSFEIFMNMANPEDLLKNKFLMLAYVETLIGMFMNLICLARFVGMLPEVEEQGMIGRGNKRV